MQNGAWRAQVVAVRAQTLWGVHALRAGHTPQTNHLQPLWQPGHQVSKEFARPGEIEADDGIALVEVGVGRREQHQGAYRMALLRRQAERNRSTVGVPQNHRPVETELHKNPSDVLPCESQAGIDVLTPLGLTGPGKVERHDVQIRTEVVHEREECLRAAHQAMEENKRGLVSGRAAPLKIGEAKTAYANLTTNHHRI